MTSAPLYPLALLYIAPACYGVYHVLLYKRDPRSAMGWIMACVLLPFAGPLAYFLFGINRVRTRARGFQRRFLSIDYEARVPGITRVGPDVPGLEQIGLRITGRAPSAGNTVRVLYNGEQTYAAMLASIRAAKERVLLATYILKVDDTGRAFADALAEAAARGVQVMVLVDGIGELYSWQSPSRLLRKRGVAVARFLPLQLFPPSIHINLRNHRKLLIVDDDIAYAGGMNISDDQTADAGRPRRVTDVHFGLAGPVVADLARVFRNDWRFATKTTIGQKAPPVPVAVSPGDARCRPIPDGPDDEMDALALTIQAVVSGAGTSVDIMTPYFLPSRGLIASLQSAALRGARVRIILPGKNNLFYVHWAHRNVLTELLGWGIEVYYQPAPFCHSKLLCIDADYSLIGSANLDPRSLRLNYELGIEVFSAQLNAELRAHIEVLVAGSTRLMPDELTGRSVPVRLRDAAAYLFSPYL
ncbi:MAG: PLDc N-terminal domain-containing protein [Gammaproteobacteria bacterium]|nr:PLDc N-terminal domain-containing protein [Gammaproteobacteria bacterium]